jgi:hypothetical protein
VSFGVGGRPILLDLDIDAAFDTEVAVTTVPTPRARRRAVPSRHESLNSVKNRTSRPSARRQGFPPGMTTLFAWSSASSTSGMTATKSRPLLRTATASERSTATSEAVRQASFRSSLMITGVSSGSELWSGAGDARGRAGPDHPLRQAIASPGHGQDRQPRRPD